MVWYLATELACLITPRSDMLFGCLLGMARRVFEAIVHPVCDRADRGPGVVDGTTADGALVAVGASVMNDPDIAGHGDAADVILIAVGTRDECRRDRVDADSPICVGYAGNCSSPAGCCRDRRVRAPWRSNSRFPGLPGGRGFGRSRESRSDRVRRPRICLGGNPPSGRPTAHMGVGARAARVRTNWGSHAQFRPQHRPTRRQPGALGLVGRTAAAGPDYRRRRAASQRSEFVILKPDGRRNMMWLVYFVRLMLCLDHRFDA